MIAIDIGSTVIKVGRIDDATEELSQEFIPRDYDAGVAKQVTCVLERMGIDPTADNIRVCSSANGGLRVGIVCLSKTFSGAALRNQVLLAGANPVFVHTFDDTPGDLRRVDILLVGGGIDCEDAGPLQRALDRLDVSKYQFGTLVYSGNCFLAQRFLARYAQAVVIDNPLGTRLSDAVGSVFEAVRRAYLDDLIYKEGVSELRSELHRGIRPTPEVASRGFLRAVLNKSSFRIVGACLAMDIGGATTDLHYTVEIVRDDSPSKPARGVSVARYVFTDLGIFASKDSLVLQLRSHPRLYEFLAVVQPDHVREAYSLMREGEYDPSAKLLSYGCLFLALDRFANGKGPGLPTADLGKIAQIIFTGGAAQTLEIATAERVVDILLPAGCPRPLLEVDRDYRLWIDGITWNADAPA
jgi:hypothetical protein